MAETLAKTNTGLLKTGDRINPERSLRVGDRPDGHFVQGQIDATGVCTERQETDGLWLFRFCYPEEFASLVTGKGLICLYGVSLTAFDAQKGSFSVAIIPFTYGHTKFSAIKVGTVVSPEFDVPGKYITGAVGNKEGIILQRCRAVRQSSLYNFEKSAG